MKSHAGIPGNEAADLLATSAISGKDVTAQIDALFAAGAAGIKLATVPKRGRSNAELDMICLVEAAHRSEIDTAWSHEHMELATRDFSNLRKTVQLIELANREKYARLEVELKQLTRADAIYRPILDFQSSLPPLFLLTWSGRSINHWIVGRDPVHQTVQTTIVRILFGYGGIWPERRIRK